jgi:predicted nucleotidyltransferase
METQMLDRLLKELKQELTQIYANRLQGIYLFGSYARQQQGPESDLDVLIVLRDMDSYSTEIRSTGELISRLSLKYGITISRTFIREIDWKTGDTPLLHNIRQEAIAA